MGKIEWAEREIEIALSKHKEHDDYFNYIRMCYESALRALKSLCNDGHSGMSICLTKKILNRLIDGKPLTPIKDEDTWVEHYFGTACKRCQCSRLGALWKDVWPSGKIEYYDNDRVLCVNVDNDCGYTSGIVTRLIDEMYPITMPYMPADNPYKVYCRDHLLDENNGDFDTIHVLYLITPDGERVEVNRVITQDEDSDEGWKEITPEELDRLKAAK